MTEPVVECVSDETRFRELRSSWNLLAQITNPRCVFLRHEWFDAAWQWRRVDSELRVLVVRRNGEPIGLAPLVLCREWRRRLPLRTLRFLAVPDTQFCDVLARPGEHQLVANTLLAWLLAGHEQWDRAVFDHLPQGTPTTECFANASARHRVRTVTFTGDTNPYIDLHMGWATFYGERSRRLKKANNLISNRLKRAVSEIEVRWITHDNLDSAQLKWLTDTLSRISAMSWKRKTGLSLDQPAPQAFLRRLLELAYAENWLSVWLLRLDGKEVAMELQLNHDGHVHALRADFDERFADLSPGSYLNWKLLEDLFDKDLRRYWMGPGLNSYKLHWTDSRQNLGGLVLHGRTLRGRIIEFIECELHPRVRRLFDAHRK